MLLVKKVFLTGCWLWLATASAAAQAPSPLLRRLNQAQQVVLISHEDFNGLIDSSGRAIPAPALVRNGQPNPKVFIKSRTLTIAQRRRLSVILQRPFRDNSITTMKCCEPHHTIFMVGPKHTAYLDICFGCRCVGASPGLMLDPFDNRKWKELQAFFDKLGLSYSGF